MDEAVFVRVRERVGDLSRDLDRLVCRHAAAGHAARERFAFQALHHEVVEAAVVPDIVNAADVGMLEARDRFRLATESFAQLRAHRAAAQHDLDGDRPIEPEIAGAIHLAHAAPAERLDDFVRPEPGAGRKRHGRATRAAASRKSRPSGCSGSVAANRSYTASCLRIGRPEISAWWWTNAAATAA